MTEEKCRKLIEEDLWSAIICCQALVKDIYEVDLNDIDRQVDRIIRHLENAKYRLKNCDDY